MQHVLGHVRRHSGQCTGILGSGGQRFTHFTLFWWWCGLVWFYWLGFFVFLPDLHVLFHALIKIKFLPLQMSGHLEAPFSCHFAELYCLKHKMAFLN